MVAHNHEQGGVCSNPHCALHDPDTAKRYWEGVKEGKDDGLIKVHVTFDDDAIGGETLWAKPIGKDQAVIRNTPFFCGHLFSFGDIVETEGDGFMREYVSTVHRNRKQFSLEYAVCNTKHNTQQRFTSLCKHLRKAGMDVEGAFPGLASVSYPIDKLTDEEAVAVIEKIGNKNKKWKLTVLSGDEGEDEDDSLN